MRFKFKLPKINIKINKPKLKKFSINFLSVFAIVVTVLGLFLFFFVFVPGKGFYDQINITREKAKNIQTAISAKDLDQAKIEINELKTQQVLLQKKYSRLKFIGSFPFVNKYYQDGKNFLNIFKTAIETGEIVVQAIEPYKDFLGIKGAATDSAKTTQDRITFLTESVEGIVPHLATIEQKLAAIETEFNQVNPNDYPEEFRGIALKSTLIKAKETLSEVTKLLKDGQPILTKTSWLLGKDSPRNYFLIFQNDAELRPTGGFWTAYAIIKVDKGKITPIVSDDIYSLDAQYNSRVPAPRPLKAYHINVPYFNLRDMNISPDFPESIGNFMTIYKKLNPKQKIDAVIAIDTQVLVDLVKVLGRVGVSGYGNFSADPDKRCDGCPQIIYQLEWIAGRPRNYIETDRKGFLGPLMNSLLGNAMGSEKEKISTIMQAFLNNIYQKHILFYFTDEEMQNAAKLANIAGSVANTTSSDYFMLNDANMASAKTNLFLKQKIKHEIISKDNKVEHKVTITYINPSKASNCNLEKGDLCLNAPKYRNWFRFYVPTGSKLVKMTGSEIEPVQYEELGKQVFEGFYGDKFPLYAKSSLKTSIQYESSIAPSANYSLLLQKQPGTKAIEYELYVNGRKYDSFSWVADKTIKISF